MPKGKVREWAVPAPPVSLSNMRQRKGEDLAKRRDDCLGYRLTSNLGFRASKRTYVATGLVETNSTAFLRVYAGAGM